MPDCRPPVAIPLTEHGLKPIHVSLKWVGKKGAVLTGDDSKFDIVVRNDNLDKKVEGTAQLTGLLTSQFPSQGANPTTTVKFAVGPGREQGFRMGDQWMFVEGKFRWVLTMITVNGQAKGTEHPLASFTVLERALYKDQSRSSLANLLISVVAASSSILAAILAFLLYAR